MSRPEGSYLIFLWLICECKSVIILLLDHIFKHSNKNWPFIKIHGARNTKRSCSHLYSRQFVHNWNLSLLSDIWHCCKTSVPSWQYCKVSDSLSLVSGLRPSAWVKFHLKYGKHVPPISVTQRDKTVKIPILCAKSHSVVRDGEFICNFRTVSTSNVPYVKL